jgi:hypothetical protein
MPTAEIQLSSFRTRVRQGLPRPGARRQRPLRARFGGTGLCSGSAAYLAGAGATGAALRAAPAPPNCSRWQGVRLGWSEEGPLIRSNFRTPRARERFLQHPPQGGVLGQPQGWVAWDKERALASAGALRIDVRVALAASPLSGWSKITRRVGTSAFPATSPAQYPAIAFRPTQHSA